MGGGGRYQFSDRARTIRTCTSKQLQGFFVLVFLGGLGHSQTLTGPLTGGECKDASKADVLDCAATPVIGQTCGDLATGGAGAAVRQPLPSALMRSGTSVLGGYYLLKRNIKKVQNKRMLEQKSRY